MLRSALSLLLLAAPASRAADWPGMLGPTRDGQSAEVGLNWKWGKDGPPKAWTIDVGAGFAGVSVADGKVFLFHRIDNDEVLSALDPATGKELWAFKYHTKYRDEFGFDNGPRCVPLVDSDTVFTHGADGDLHAVAAKTGKKLWGKNLMAEYQPKKGYFGVGAGPVVVGDVLLVNVGAKGAGVVGFDKATGKELWKAGDDGPGYSSPAVLDVGGKPHAAFFTRAGVMIVRAADGKLTHTLPWRSRLDASVNAATPLVRKGEVFVTSSYGTGGTLRAVKADELAEVWANDASLSCQYATPVLVGDHLYGVHGRADTRTGELRCVEWKTGKMLWTVKGFGVAHVIAVDGGLLAVTEDGDAVRFAADPKAYREAARAKVIGGVVRAAPALADGRLYVRNEKRLTCVKLK
jgi:outer membrane protein assembly factor BamB